MAMTESVMLCIVTLRMVNNLCDRESDSAHACCEEGQKMGYARAFMEWEQRELLQEMFSLLLKSFAIVY